MVNRYRVNINMHTQSASILQDSDISDVLPGLSSGAAPLRVMNLPFSYNHQQRRQSHDSRTFHKQNVQGFHDKRKRKIHYNQ